MPPVVAECIEVEEEQVEVVDEFGKLLGFEMQLVEVESWVLALVPGKLVLVEQLEPNPRRD